MDGRQNRILIPSSVALISFGSTFWLVGGDTSTLLKLFGGQSGDEATFLLSAGSVSLGIGYLCNALFLLYTLCRLSSRIVNFPRLLEVFGLKDSKSEERGRNLGRNLSSVWRWRQRRQLGEPLLDEVHLRLHSYAPQTLIDFCTRRNTAWYIANTSGLASIIGWFVGSVISMAHQRIDTHSIEADCFGMVNINITFTVSWFDSVGGILSFAFLVVIPGALFWQGNKSNQEFWGVCLRWIKLDLQEHYLTPGWLNMERPGGVIWMSGSNWLDGRYKKNDDKSKK